jgi:hypothetical protein
MHQNPDDVSAKCDNKVMYPVLKYQPPQRCVGVVQTGASVQAKYHSVRYDGRRHEQYSWGHPDTIVSD